MKRPQHIPVLYQQYQPPALPRGDRVFCHVRDCLLVITGWSDAPISWPRGRPLDARGGVSLIVDDELVRAIEHESATAIMYWWGISSYTVIKWRKALGVNRQNNEGSQLLIHAATAKARDVAEQNGPTEQSRQKHRENARRRRLWELAPKVTHGIAWTPEHLALLGTMSDRDVALRTGHPLFSVKTRRQDLGIPGFKLQRERGGA